MTNEIDQAQFTQTYRELLPAISRYLSRRVPEREIEDLAAQTFEIAWRKRADVAAGEELPWLYKIASFQVANYRRKHQSAIRYLVLSLVPETAPSAESLAIFDIDLAAAWRTLFKTQPQQVKYRRTPPAFDFTEPEKNWRTNLPRKIEQ
jgi:RNA polymerase sigma-70 factor (ECF subfamily)